MSANALLWWWLVHAMVLCGLVLVVGCSVTAIIRQPADRLRVIQWVLIGCLIGPWLPGVVAWKSISLNLVKSRTTVPSRLEVGNGSDRAAASSQFELRPIPVEHDGGTIAPRPTVANAGVQGAGRAPTVRSADSEILAAKERMNVVRAPVDSVAESRLPRALRVWAVVLYVAIVFCMAWWWLAGIWRRHVLECAAT